MKTLVGTFNQERALVGAFSIIVKTDCEIDGSLYTALLTTTPHTTAAWGDLIDQQLYWG